MEIKVNRYPNLESAITHNKSHFFILNTSNEKARGGAKSRGNVIFSITSNGREIPIMFPPTWAPLDLLTYASMADIGASSSIRSSQREGLIAFVDEESAKMLMTLPGYEAEVNSIQERQRSISSSDTGIQSTNFSVTGGMMAQSSVAANPANAFLTRLIELNAEEAATGQVSEALIRELRTNMSSLRNDECKYIIENVQDRSSFLYLVAVDANGGSGNLMLEELPIYQERFVAK